MIWTVVWLPAAEQELATLWLDPPTRPQVTLAADKIDRLLRRDPEQLGESRDNKQRLVFEYPLAALYRVNELDRLVQVIHVWKFA